MSKFSDLDSLLERYANPPHRTDEEKEEERKIRMAALKITRRGYMNKG
jgi:hypothetical protein